MTHNIALFYTLKTGRVLDKQPIQHNLVCDQNINKKSYDSTGMFRSNKNQNSFKYCTGSKALVTSNKT